MMEAKRSCSSFPLGWVVHHFCSPVLPKLPKWPPEPSPPPAELFGFGESYGVVDLVRARG